jgi:hypothetical protein
MCLSAAVLSMRGAYGNNYTDEPYRRWAFMHWRPLNIASASHSKRTQEWRSLGETSKHMLEHTVRLLLPHCTCMVG